MSRSCAECGSAGRMTCRLWVTEARAPGRAARSACTARPWPRLRWCTADSESAWFSRPGACTPEQYPRYAEHHGSFRVVQVWTRSPSTSAALPAYAANASEVARDVHPPASSSCCGRSQWYSVAIGATPAASSWSTSRE